MKITETKLALAATESPVPRMMLVTKYKLYKYLAQARALAKAPHECGWTYRSEARGTKPGNKSYCLWDTKKCAFIRASQKTKEGSPQF